MKIEETFGVTIKKLREERQMTLREVAKELNIDISMLAKIEKNHRKPTKKMINNIASYFKVNDKDLMIAFLSDSIAYKIIDEEDLATEVLIVAEQKVEYLRTKKY